MYLSRTQIEEIAVAVMKDFNDFFFNEKTADRRQISRNTGRRGMRTVRGAEGVIDINIRKGSEFFRKSRIILLFGLVKTKILKKDDLF